MPKIAIYARKSSESEDRQILSIESQVNELKKFADGQRLTVSKVFVESKSAKIPGRPVFGELFKYIQQGEFDAVLCWKLDRLARNPIDGGAVIWAMEEQQLSAVHTPQRTFNNTGNDKFWMQLEFGMAKKYVDDLSDNVKRGMRAKLDMGWLPSLPPLGYLNDPVDRTIVPDPERFALLRKLWDLMLTGAYSLNRLHKIATTDLGLRNRQFKRMGGEPVARSLIYKMFRNPFYYGLIVRKGESFHGKHKKMISKQEFDKVQSLLQRGQKSKPKRLWFQYTGLIKCGECGAAITAERKTNRYGSQYTYYHCTHRKSRTTCSQRVITESTLHGQVLSLIESVSISLDEKSWALEIFDELDCEEKEKDDARDDALSRRLSSCQKELSELVTVRLRGLVSDAEFLDRKTALHNEQIELKEIVERSKFASSRVREHIIALLNFVAGLNESYEIALPEEKKEILLLLGSNFTLTNKKLSVDVAKPFSLVQVSRGVQHETDSTFEHKDFALTSAKAGVMHSYQSRLLNLVNNIRTFFRENPQNSSYQLRPKKART